MSLVPADPPPVVRSANQDTPLRHDFPGWNSPVRRPTAMSGRPASASEAEAADAEREFMAALHAYKQESGRMFPTWSEVLEVLRKLGYEKVETPGAEPAP